jgi:hypothetical protein
MVSHLFFYQLVLVALVWLCLMLQWAWPSDPAAVCPTALEPTPRLVKLFELPCFNVGVCEVGECPVVYYRPAHARTSSNNT